MARQKLSPERIREFTCSEEKEQDFLFDTEMPRLAVRVARRGTKTFVFESKLNRKTIRRTIGEVAAWSLKDARSEARRLQILIDQGIDPREVDRQRAEEAHLLQIAADRQETTLGDVWPVYIEARRKQWGERHLQDHIELAQSGGMQRKRGKGLTKPGPIAALLPLRLIDLTPAQLASWIEHESVSRPARVRSALRVLVVFSGWCEEQVAYKDLIPPKAFSTKKVREAVPKASTKSDCLQREQLALWFESIKKIADPVMSAYLQGLLLTGARREELATLRWESVDLKWRSLTIRDKVEGSRTIPLTPYMANLLADLKARNDTPPPQHRILHGKRIAVDLERWAPSPWVFPSSKAAGSSLTDQNRAHAQALSAAGLPNITLHGLRRSFGTLAEWVEVPAGIAAQIMGHKPSAIAEKHYIRRPLDLLRMWHTKIEAWILEQARIPQPDENKDGLQIVKGKDRT